MQTLSNNGMQKIKSLYAKRDALLEELRSEEHYNATPTLSYGDHDPFVVQELNCVSCGSKGTLSNIIVKDRPRFDYTCSGCDVRIYNHQKRSWEAVLEWNILNSDNGDYKLCPLFGISTLEHAEAKDRMISISHNLMLRKQLANVERVLAFNKQCRFPGRKYEERLDAYLKWSIYCLKLL